MALSIMLFSNSHARSAHALISRFGYWCGYYTGTTFGVQAIETSSTQPACDAAALIEGFEFG